jgi:hypothetical protein
LKRKSRSLARQSGEGTGSVLPGENKASEKVLAEAPAGACTIDQPLRYCISAKAGSDRREIYFYDKLGKNVKTEE